MLDDHTAGTADRLLEPIRTLIDQDLSVVSYGLTTITVHGEAGVKGDTRQHGMSKDGGIRRQVMLSPVQTADGLPVAHEVHAGNTAEAPTLLPTIRKLLQRWPLKCVVACFLVLIPHRVLRMRLMAAHPEESPTRLLVTVSRIQQLAASTADGRVVRGVTNLLPTQNDLFAAIGVPTLKPEELSQAASAAVM